MEHLNINSKHQNKIDTGIFIGMLIVLFLYGLLYCIVDIRLIFYVAAPFCIYSMWRTKENPFDLEFLFIFISMLLVALQAYMRDPNLNIQWSDVKLAWIFPTLYVFGKAALGINSKMNSEKATLFTIGALALGMYVQAIINYIYGFSHPHFERSSWYGFFTNDWETKNVYDFGFLLMLPAFYWSFKKRKENKILFIVVTIIDCVAIGLSLTAKGRTITAMFILINGFLAAIDLLTNWKKYSAKLHRTVFAGIGVIGVALTGLMLAIKLNILSLGDKYNASFLVRDGGIFNNVRFGIYKDAIIKTIKTHEGGWIGAYENGGTHDTWLEFSRVYGTAVFVFLIIFVALTLIKSISLFKNKDKNALDYYIVGAMLVLFLYLTLEPVGYYPRYYILFYIYLAGIVSGYFYKR